jgi:putative salt-induced outer membrane protein YdiY
MQKSRPHCLLRFTGILTLTLCGLGVATAQQPAPAPAPEKKPKWETSAAAGLTVTKGNSDTITGTGNLLSQRKWVHNEVRLGADVTYGKNDGVKSAETYHAFGQYNWLFSERAYGYFRADGMHDDIADIQYRFTVGPGAGYYIIKTAKTQLSAEAGPGVVFERQGSRDDTYFTLRIGERFEHKFNDKTHVWQSAEWLPQLDELKNSIINTEIGLETKLTQKLSLRVLAQDTFDNVPVPGRKKNDLKLVTAIAYTF